MIDKLIPISCYLMFFFSGLFLCFKIEIVSEEAKVLEDFCYWGMATSALIFILLLIVSFVRDEKVLTKINE